MVQHKTSDKYVMSDRQFCYVSNIRASMNFYHPKVQEI